MPLINQAIEIAGEKARLLDTKVAVLTQARAFDEAQLLAEAVLSKRRTAVRHFYFALALHGGGKTGSARVQLHLAHKQGVRASRLHVLERPLYRQLCATTDVTVVP